MLGKTDFLVDVDREALERMLGLDVPAYVQYGRWLGGILLHGSLGDSLVGNRAPVEQTILSRLPVTIQLGIMSIVVGLVIALPVGIYSAMRQDSAADYVGALGRRHRPGGAELLAGHNGDALSVHLVELVASDEVDSRLRRSAGESRYPHHSQPDSGDGAGRGHDAADAHDDAGGAAPGLYPDGVGEGSEGAGGRGAARHQECAHTRS